MQQYGYEVRGIRTGFLSQNALRHSTSWVIRSDRGPLSSWKCGGLSAERRNIAYLLGGPGALADVLAVLQPGEDLLDGRLLFLPLPHLETLTTLAGLLLLVLERLLNELNVLQPQLLADDIQVAGGVDVALDVDNLGIVETPDDLKDGIDSANVRQEGVAKTSTCRGTTGQAGDVIDCEVGRHLRLGVVLLAQPVEALIGDDDASLLGVNSGIGEVLATVSATVVLWSAPRVEAYGRVAQVALGDGLEQCGFADVC
jgi:hypothetical protein